MKIAVNTLPLLRNKAGAEQYTLNIIKQLAKIDKENEYVLLVTNINKDIYKIDQKNFQQEVCEFSAASKIKRVLYEQLVLPFKLKKIGVDVLFSPCNIMPIFSPCRNATMIFDMHWFVEASKLSFLRVFYVKIFVKLSACFSDVILTLSESSKADILKFTNVSSDKIVIIPIGTTPLCDLKNTINNDKVFEVKNKYNIKKEYIVFLGQLLYRKNIDAVIKAMFLIKKEKGEIPFDFVVVGGLNEAFPSLKELTESLGFDNNIKFLGQLEDEEVAAIFSGASVFIYPSLYEGFGIPVLEALHYGIPTITSSVSSLPEVGGDACLYINPKDVDDIKEAIIKLWYDNKLREDLVKKGVKQVLKFDWKKIAEKTLEACIRS